MPAPAFLRPLAALLILAAAPLARGQQHLLPAPSATPLLTDDKRYTPPKVLNHPAPAYPEAPHLNRIEGVLRVRFAVGEDGTVTGVIISQSSGSVFLDSAVARDPVFKTWTFQPATFDGQPVPSTVEREFEFRLDPAEERALALQRLALPVGTPPPPFPPRADALKAHGPWTCTLGLYWTERGLVDLIYVDKTSGSHFMDNTALRWVYTHWRIDPKDIPPKDKEGKQAAMMREVTIKP